jgi:hypothetical protein
MNELDDDVEIYKTMDPVQDELLALELSKDASPTEDNSVVEAMVAGQQDYGASEGLYLSSDALAVAKAVVQNGSGASVGNSDAHLVMAAGYEQEPIAEEQQNLKSGANDRGLQIVAACAEATAAGQHHSQASEGLGQRSEVSVGFNAMQVHESSLETGDAGENDAQHNTLSKVSADFAATLDAAALFPQPAETQANLDTDAGALTTQPKENEMHVQATDQDQMDLCTKKTTRDMTKKMAGMNKSKDTTLRCSKRAQTKSDEHTLEKTTRMAEIHNLEASGNNSFVSFSNSRISSNLEKIGISLGRDDNVVRSSTVAIKT